MSLSRAFTTRRIAKMEDAALKRSLTTKHSFGSSIRQVKISAPVELLSTTNMLSYNAPDLYPSSDASRSSQSGDDSDSSPSSRSRSTSQSTPMTSPDNSSVESSPTTPEPNHLSCYFGTSRSSIPGNDAPLIPRRSPSHTKKHSIERSASRMSAFRKGSMSTARSSINMFAASVDVVEQQHPFGNELAQVSELAEEYGISKEKLAVVDEEEQELVSRGLFKFCAEDYMSEIHGLVAGAFGSPRPTMPPMASIWI